LIKTVTETSLSFGKSL